MEIDKEITIDDIINVLEKVSFFDDKEEYMKLHDASLIDVENESELFEILEDTFRRYKRYIKEIVFTNESIRMKELIERYIKEYNNYKVDESRLLKLMKYIDKMILDMIHDSKESRFWL